MTRRTALLLSLASLSEAPAQAAGPPVIIDTDVGSDDLMAIAFLLTRPDIRIEAITTANGLAHVDRGVLNVAKLLALAGRADIPVYIGRGQPLEGHRAFPDEWRRDSDEMRGVFDSGKIGSKPQAGSAAQFLAGRLAQHSRPVRILALGPLTNIGKVFRQEPGAISTVQRLVLMGGALYVPGNLGDGGFFQTDNHTAEWNIYVDPLAASIVFGSGVPITMVGLDATGKVPIDVAFLENFKKSAKSELGRLVARVLEGDRPHIEGGYFQAWDPLAAVTLANPGICKAKPLAIEVRQRAPEEGRTVESKGRKRNVDVALEVDTAGFKRAFLAAF